MFAAKGIEAEFMDRLNVYATTGLTLLAITVLVWLILRLRSCFIESDDSDEPLEEMLTQFRQLKRDGELTEEEYRLISQRLSDHRVSAKSAAVNPQSPPDGDSLEHHNSTDPTIR